MSKTNSTISAKIEKGNLVITLPINKKPTPSASGKTLVVASSHGNQQTELEVETFFPVVLI